MDNQSVKPQRGLGWMGLAPNTQDSWLIRATDAWCTQRTPAQAVESSQDSNPTSLSTVEQRKRARALHSVLALCLLLGVLLGALTTQLLRWLLMPQRSPSATWQCVNPDSE